MSTVGTYEEKLPCKGTLRVFKSDWEIQYYFPGPDLRHNGTFKTLPGGAIEQYIQAYQNNWAEYVRLKATIPKGGEFSKLGEAGMTIRIGMFEGVCLVSYHMPISSETSLRAVLDGFRYAKERVTRIQGFLNTL